MKDAAARSARRPARVWRWLVLGVLLIGAAGFLVVLAFEAPTQQSVVRQADPPAAQVPVAESSAPGPGEQASARPALPVHLTIPAISVSTDLVRLGLQEDNTVEVPRDPARAGWYEHGPAPGQPGSAVVLGHVDSVEGPAVFYRLAQLRPGSIVQVRLSDGSVARFAVRRVATYPNDDFPAEQVYAGGPDRRLLNLVTCGGWYDADRGGWQANVVVFTELVPGA